LETYDLAVVGGGASGLAAALAAAELARAKGRPLKIAVLEKNPRVGKKLLMTGNGRCNLTNLRAAPESYHGDAKAAETVLLRFPPEKILSLFRSQGLLCREAEEGRVYPHSLQAQSVLNVLRRGLEEDGARLICDFPVSWLESVPGGFLAACEKDKVRARSLVVATGGKACPQSGSTGDGYALLRPFHHSATPLSPALVQVRTDPKRVRPLKGVRSSAAASFLTGGRRIGMSLGEVQFTENSLSGICIFELAHFLGDSSMEKAEISLDLAPEYGAGDLAGWLLAQARRFWDRPAAELTEGFLNKALGAEAVKAALGSVSVPGGSLTEDDARRIAGVVKDFRFPALGTLSWQSAQVTAGGVPLAEVDGALQSRFCRGLYLCGELLNVDGGCGGYNLQWAWASGVAAGLAAAGAMI